MTAVALALARPQAHALSRVPYYREVGERFLIDVFGDDWLERAPSAHDAIAQTPIDVAWIEKRYTQLEPMSDGPMRLIPQAVWHLSRALMQRGDGWWHLWCECARRTPRLWLIDFCGLAIATLNGSQRALDNHRAKSMLVAGILAWQLAEYDPQGDPAYPFVIRGLPYGAWQWLLSYWEACADGTRLRVPSRAAVFGVHDGGGDPRRGECGYIASWKREGIAYSTQPCGWEVAPGLRGKPRKNADGDWECWAIHELRLRIQVSTDEVLTNGPPKPWWGKRPRKRPLSDSVEDLSAFTDECEREWFPDEVNQPVSMRLLPPLAAQSVNQGEYDAPIVTASVNTLASVRLLPPLAAQSAVQGEYEEPIVSEPAEDELVGELVNDPVAVWLLPPSAVEDVPLRDDDVGGGLRSSGPAILSDYVAQALPLTGRPTQRTVYGCGKLHVMRASEDLPINPRVRRAIESFERIARLRERGPPDPPE